MKKALTLAAVLMMTALGCFAQTQPNLENGWKPFGSYEGSHLDTVNVMNGNLMFHAPLTPDTPQRGSLKVSNVLYGTSKDWQVVCSFNTNTQQWQCKWQKGGGYVSIQFTPNLTVHRTLNKQFTSGSNTTTAAYGYTVITADGASHPMHGVTGTEDSNLEPTQFDSADLSGFHLALSASDPTYTNILDQVTVTDRSGNQYQGNFGFVSGCGRIQFSTISAPGPKPPVFDDAPAGDQYCSQVAYAFLVTDSNGNQISIHGPQNSNPTVDTLGKTPALILPTGSGPTTDFSGCSSSHTISNAYLYSYQDPNGVTRQIKLCYAEVQIQTNFAQPNPYNPSGLVAEAVTSTDPSSGFHFVPVVNAVFPDGTRYTFDYDSYGELTLIGLPSGGSITYTWQTVTFNNCDTGNITQKSRAVATRTLNDGQGHSFTWHYNWGTPNNGSLINIVSDPLGNDTAHTFTDLGPQAGLGPGCKFYETSTVQYQGASGSNLPIQRVDTAFIAASILLDDPTGPGSGVPGLGNVFATDVTTTLYTNGTASKFKKLHKDPDQPLGAGLPIFGNTIRQLEYDWAAPGANPPLLRQTDTTYQWQVSSAYRTAGLLDLPASVSVIDPNSNSPTRPNCPGWAANLAATTKSCVAETDYVYDEFALQPNSGGIPAGTLVTPAGPRGNQTSVKKWLSTSNSFITSQTRWYDTGEPYQKIDPPGHTTTVTYDPAYAGAYVTQTCSPTTSGPAGNVAHCVSGTYDFTTGVLTSFTNENATQQASGNTAGDAAHTSNYSYDLMFRLTSAQAPPDPDPTNGGLRATTSFSYATAQGVYPWSVTRTRSVTNTASDSATTFFDGLGRVTKTQHAIPSGPPSTVDTVYDPVGRVASVSNPYFTTGDLTYGVTQTIYDALDRPLLVQKPDSSYSTVAYHDNCTTTQDEAGNPRRSCSDGLGRLVQVDEPGDPTAGPATDTSNTNSTASATVNISGGEQSVIIPPPKCPPRQICDPTPETVYDSGTVSVTVNGHTTSATYGPGDTASSVALHLANNITADAGAVVNAGASGTLITLASRTSGRAGDYTLSFSTTWDTADFANPSFSGLTSNFRLTGGANDSVFSNAYVTQYHYDVLGNLLCVEQYGNVAQGVNGAAPCPAPSTDPNSPPTAPDPNNPWRLRRFAYDSLSRLRWASNPESGVISYAYDADSNLLQKTSPKSNQLITGTATTTISYCYDEGNRLLAKGYADSPSPAQLCTGGSLPAPAANFTYDQGQGAKGHLSSLTDQVGSGSYTFDSLSRTTTEQRTIAGISKSIGYAYNLDGSLKQLTYPSLRVVNYTPDSAGRLISAIDANGTNYVSSATYNADNSLKSLLSGNTGSFAGITSSFVYNARLQLCRITAFTSGSVSPNCDDPAVHGNLMDRGYNFNLGSADNGNVISITNYRDTSRSQSFTYDPLNRLKSGWSTANTGGLSWGENYTIDPWGNLMIAPMSGKAHGGNFQCAGDNSNRATCLSYDPAGNVTANGGTAYSYDQETRLSSTAGTNYLYDANGNRVKKSSGSIGTLYWYASPGIIAETDLTGTLKSEYVFFGRKRVARIDSPGNSVHYYLSDHLSSTTMVVSAVGSQEEESDYSPYGTEYQVTSTGANHFKFTGKERDGESLLDYFGARYYSNGLGRFITPDWAAKAAAVPYADFANPQSLNLYRYPSNPETYADADGHCGDWCQKMKNYWLKNAGWRTDKQVKDDAKAFRDKVGKNGAVGIYNSLTGKTEAHTGAELEKMSDTQVVAFADKVNAATGDDSEAAERIAQALPVIPAAGNGQWSYGSNKSAQKWQNQMSQRGWTEQQINEAIEKGQQFPAQNNINPSNGATRYVHPETGRSVVVDNVTRELIHVGGDGFKY